MRRHFPLATLATVLATIFGLAPAEEATHLTDLALGRAESRVFQETGGESGRDPNRSESSKSDSNTSDSKKSDSSKTESNKSSNEARIDIGVGERVLGNLGLNVAAGRGNVQANTGALQRQSEDGVFAGASTSVQQTTRSDRRAKAREAPNEAGLDAALAGASGNLGINVIAGSGNAQANQFAIVDVEQASTAQALTTVDQRSAGARLSGGSASGLRDSAQNASIGTGALFQLNGSVGVSVGAGSGNAQANSLSVVQSAR